MAPNIVPNIAPSIAAGVAEPPERERVLVAQWRAGQFAGRWLCTTAGEDVRVLYAGRPGGPSGPDFRDAVLLRRDGSRVCGDVELHLRARGWRLHGHDHDPRYNRVVLHVVRRAEGASATPLASGATAPILQVIAMDALGASLAQAPRWPCASPSQQRRGVEMRELLVAAGQARFEERATRFAQALAGEEAAAHTDEMGAAWDPVDRVAFVALAEGLAYGREREPLRQAGAWLAAGGAPDALTREAPRLPRLDAVRLEGLLALRARWQAGPWTALRAALRQTPDAVARDALLRALMVPGGMVSRGRAAILAVNVVLPLAAAWAARQGEAADAALGERARALYAAFPGLPSNQITREMARQLGMLRQPRGARAQQGLQHLWARHCREKRCAGCPCALSAGTQQV